MSNENSESKNSIIPDHWDMSDGMRIEHDWRIRLAERLVLIRAAEDGPSDGYAVDEDIEGYRASIIAAMLALAEESGVAWEVELGVAVNAFKAAYELDEYQDNQGDTA